MAEMRKCVGSARFGIEPHDAPIEDFPRQPSQEDGLGRMCKTHWNQYTKGLARDAAARKAAAEASVSAEGVTTAEGEGPEPRPTRSRRAKAASEETAG